MERRASFARLPILWISPRSSASWRATPACGRGSERLRDSGSFGTARSQNARRLKDLYRSLTGAEPGVEGRAHGAVLQSATGWMVDLVRGGCGEGAIGAIAGKSVDLLGCTWRVLGQSCFTGEVLHAVHVCE